MARKLFLLFTGCLSLYTTLLQAQQTPVYSLNQLAVRVADEPVPLQSDLARIALTELAAVYADEAEQARYEMRHRAKRPASRRWSVAVQKLADDYAALAESVMPSTTIQVNIGPEGSLYLQLDGKMVVVSSPRMNEQSAFEQRVIERFCNLNRCADLWTHRFCRCRREPISHVQPHYGVSVRTRDRRVSRVTGWSSCSRTQTISYKNAMPAPGSWLS